MASDAWEPIDALDGGEVIGRMVSGKRRDAVATCLYTYLADFSNGAKSAQADRIDIGMMPAHAHRGPFGANNDAAYPASYRVSLSDRATGTAITVQQGPATFPPLPRQMLMDIVSTCADGK